MRAYYPPVLDDEDEELRRRGVPADFPGVVMPNPDGRKLSLDTDSGIEPTELSDNAKLSLPRSGAAAKMDVSSPPMNQMGAPEMREASAGYPAVGSTSDLESHIHGPAYAPVETPKSPAQQRLETLTAQGAPAVQPLHGFKKFADTLGQVFAPGVEERLRYGPQREYQRERGEAEKDVAGETTAQTAPAAREEINAKPGLTEAQTREANANADAKENPQEKLGQTAEEQTIHDLMTGDNGRPRLNPQTGNPYSYIEAFQAVKQAAQDVKPDKAQPAHITYDGGVPVSVVSADGKTFDVNDPKLPPELKPLVDAANRAHGQHVSEDADKQARAFQHQETFDASKETHKRYETAMDAEQRLSRMEAAYAKAVKGDQQAMLSMLTDHIGMTLGMQKGARITKDILNEAATSLPWLQKVEAAFDSRGYLSGVKLSPEQMSQMLDLGYEARDRAVQGAHDSSALYGVAPPQGADAVFGRRKPGDKPALQQGGEETKPPKEADHGMKWQHRTANGKTEWRQVPAQ